MSGSMDLHEFERLWPEREHLDPETRAAVEEFAAESRDAKAFVEGGAHVRNLCLSLGEEKAADDFAYRMGIYARNHLTPERSLSEHAWFRWSAVSAGLVTGALAMMLIVGGPAQIGVNQGMTSQASLETAVEPSETPSVGQDELAEKADSTMNQADSVSANRPDAPQPNWDLHQVSTSE